MRHTKRAIAIVAFTLVSCSSQIVPAATPPPTLTALRLYSTTATVPLMLDLTSAYTRSSPAIVFDTVSSSYQNALDRVMVLDAPYFITNHLPIDSPLWAAPIGQDGIAVIVHRDNLVGGLTLAQVRDVYQGRLTNWRELGGSDLPILVVSREEGSGTRAEFEQQVMGLRATTPTAQIAPSSADVVRSVAAQPGSIGYVSLSYVDGSVRALALEGVAAALANVGANLYPLRSLILIAGLEEPMGDFRAFIGWVQSPAGQAVVAQRYAPLNTP